MRRARAATGARAGTHAAGGRRPHAAWAAAHHHRDHCRTLHAAPPTAPSPPLRAAERHRHLQRLCLRARAPVPGQPPQPPRRQDWPSPGHRATIVACAASMAAQHHAEGCCRAANSAAIDRTTNGVAAVAGHPVCTGTRPAPNGAAGRPSAADEAAGLAARRQAASFHRHWSPPPPMPSSRRGHAGTRCTHVAAARRTDLGTVNRVHRHPTQPPPARGGRQGDSRATRSARPMVSVNRHGHRTLAAAEQHAGTPHRRAAVDVHAQPPRPPRPPARAGGDGNAAASRRHFAEVAAPGRLLRRAVPPLERPCQRCPLLEKAAAVRAVPVGAGGRAR